MTCQPASGLEALEQTLARDFAYLNYPPENWIPSRLGPDGKTALDVLIVGGGMCGVTAAFALRRLGITHLRIVDEADERQEGPWRTFARMLTLRSPKHLTGPALGLPNLTFRAWFEAQFGHRAWENLDRIPTAQWADYLTWFGRVTDAGVENRVSLRNIAPSGAFLKAELVHTERDQKETLYVRRIVLATGRDALARPRIPSMLQPYRGTQVFHTCDAPDRDMPRDKDVVVVGVAASAFDYAAEAIEAGARCVTMLGRSATIPRINKAKQLGYPGFTLGHAESDDHDRFSTFRDVVSCGVPPPRDSVLRVSHHDNFEIRLQSEITGADRRDGRIYLTTTSGTVEADVVILGTGFHVDVSRAAFLSELAPAMKTWRDRVPGAEPAGELVDFPYLGKGFEFQARTEDAVGDSVQRIHCFNHAAMVSLGNLANDIPAVSEGAERLAGAIAQSFFGEDRADHRAALTAYDDPELLGDEIPNLANW